MRTLTVIAQKGRSTKPRWRCICGRCCCARAGRSRSSTSTRINAAPRVGAAREAAEAAREACGVEAARP